MKTDFGTKLLAHVRNAVPVKTTQGTLVELLVSVSFVCNRIKYKLDVIYRKQLFHVHTNFPMETSEMLRVRNCNTASVYNGNEILSALYIEQVHINELEQYFKPFLPTNKEMLNDVN